MKLAQKSLVFGHLQIARSLDPEKHKLGCKLGLYSIKARTGNAGFHFWGS